VLLAEGHFIRNGPAVISWLLPQTNNSGRLQLPSLTHSLKSKSKPVITNVFVFLNTRIELMDILKIRWQPCTLTLQSLKRCY